MIAGMPESSLMNALHWIAANCRFAADVAAVLTREFPQADPSFVQAIAAQTSNVFIARWLLRNAQPETLTSALGLIRQLDQNKQKLKANGHPVDLAQYDLPNLSRTIGQLDIMQKSKSEVKMNIPKAILEMIATVANKGVRALPPESQQQAKDEIFYWISGIWQKLIKEAVWNAYNIERSHGQYGMAEREEIAENVPFFLEDKNDYVRLVQAFYQWKATPAQPGESEVTILKRKRTQLKEFSNKSQLSAFLDFYLTDEQKAQKYMIDPAASEGLEIISEGPLRAIKITEWNEHFADELCKQANWCVRDKRAFDNYDISPSNPLFLILEGNKQVALVGFESQQAKDVNDTPINGAMAAAIYPIIQKIADTYYGGKVPIGGTERPDETREGGENDFDVFIGVPPARNGLYESVMKNPIKSLHSMSNYIQNVNGMFMESAGDENQEAVFDEMESQYMKILNAKKDEIMAIIMDPSRTEDSSNEKWNFLDEMIKKGLAPKESEIQFLKTELGSDQADVSDMVWSGLTLASMGQMTRQDVVDYIVSRRKNWFDRSEDWRESAGEPMAWKFNSGRLWIVKAGGQFLAATEPEGYLLDTMSSPRAGGKFPDPDWIAPDKQKLDQVMQSIQQRTAPAVAWVRGNCRFAGQVNDYRNVNYFALDPSIRKPEQNYLSYGHEGNEGDSLWAWLKGKLVVKPTSGMDPEKAMHEVQFQGPEVPLRHYYGRYDGATGVVTLLNSKELPEPPSALMSALHMHFNPSAINMYS